MTISDFYDDDDDLTMCAFKSAYLYEIYTIPQFLLQPRQLLPYAIVTTTAVAAFAAVAITTTTCYLCS